jgi:hypothetical protein
MSKESETHLYDVMMFPLNITILLMHMGTKDMMRDANLSKKRIELLILIEQRARLDLPISRWGGELNVDDPKFPGDARNSHNQYTTDPMVTDSCFHELA